MCSLGGMDDISFIFVLLIESDSRTEKSTKGRREALGEILVRASEAGGSPAMLPVH